MSPAPQRSPDGRWWWDSQAWRQVSADGRWWWDGSQWQALPAAPSQAPIGSTAVPSWKALTLRYGNRCVVCGTSLPRGTAAMYHSATKTVRCRVCPADADAGVLSAADVGVAGASSQAEYERRKASHEARLRGQLGDILRGVALAVEGEAGTTTAWRRGAIGEQKFAEAIAGVSGVTVLNDRRVPGTRGNIDHIVIAPAGVFVVDTKLYKGVIEVRDLGLFKSDKRLYVGRRDCSHLAANMEWQITAVREVITAAAADLSGVSIEPVLYFVDGDWPLFPPQAYQGVRLEGKRSIKGLITIRYVLDPATIARLSRILAVALPAKR